VVGHPLVGASSARYSGTALNRESGVPTEEHRQRIAAEFDDQSLVCAPLFVVIRMVDAKEQR
jgi:hypothetical protein